MPGVLVYCVGCSDEDGEWTGDAMDRKDLERSKQFPHLGAAFRTNVEQFGPNDFFVMQKCMKEVSFSPPGCLPWF